MHGKNKKAPIVKVMSFNIAHGLGMDGIVDLEKTAEVIEDSCATIVALQEVDRYFSDRSSFVDQVEWLSERLGMYAAYGANMNFAPEDSERPNRQYGNMILSKYPIKYVENHLLTQVHCPFGNNEQRGILETVIEVDGIYLSVFNTHLALKDEELVVSVDEILAITGKSHFPRIIAGDFNATASNVHMQKLSKHFQDAFLKMKRGDAYTYPSPYVNKDTTEVFWPATRIDYILADSEVDVVQVAVIETAVSDHLPIVADMVLADAKVGVKDRVQKASAKV
ncbi:endonuclease/exonuclease/phosphatase family metal-dependent hydrolase [Planomicrobium stackebrandtii]|uniref:Endonuclease/exonuclease/phosphatase family metal-dependent hydrolase n=1 Tax=Planomicrobium stackebrandtii TaxID=253160 RepID=A0ABU0GZE6_9BACL|nr:endonuclease/exonuclease/phosphatase family protein [Planomicrobium stackebrandtii]MDQ0430721.1 endonuclease/exonuclease/phosphatase family metal-dependent hydrolase [Planomicrobium stackebrandtii]